MQTSNPSESNANANASVKTSKPNISLLVNLCTALLIACSFFFPAQSLWRSLLLSTGLYGLAGAMTNWLAVHMLFERIPLVYGSGIIALNFAEIKRELEELMVEQFFSAQQIEAFLATEVEELEIDARAVSALIHYEGLFEKMKESLATGNPLIAMALPLLDSHKEKVTASMRQAVELELSGQDFQNQLKSILQPQHQGSGKLEAQVRSLIQRRLTELTPDMVKNIIHQMMASKLVWLVIWGGIFGCLLGLIAGLLRSYGILN